MRQRYIFSALLLTLPILLKASPNTTPMEYIENKGQWAGPFLYKAVSGTGNIFLEKNSITYVVADPANKHHNHPDASLPKSEQLTLKYHAYRMSFENARQDVAIQGDKPQQHYYNYFLGNDPAKWQTEIHPNLAVDYKNLYQNIDIHMSSAETGLKYDFILKPGANADDISMRFDGVKDIATRGGDLVIKTSVGNITELKPYAYQYIDGAKKEVNCLYRVRGLKVSFYFPDGYDDTETLIIDPTVQFATFSGSSYDNWGFTATYDAQGNFYAGGIVSDAAGINGGSGYPTTLGAFDVTYNGGSLLTGAPYPCDISITKFNSSGSALIYSTYLGGSDNEQPHSLYVDGNNNLVIAGRTFSANYPTTPGAYDVTYNGGGDLVVTKFNASGTALVGSTYVGGSAEDVTNFDPAEFVWGGLKHNYGDDARSEVIVDKFNNIYIAGNTRSTNFPTTPTAIQGSLVGQQDGVVLKLNSSLTALIWSTYLGGTNDDAAYVLSLDTSQNVLFVAGGTMSADFPSTPGTYKPTFQGGTTDGYIARFQNGGSFALQKMTFIGTTGYDQCYGVQVDNANNVYAMGQTLGGTFPVNPAGVYSNPNSSQFVIKLNYDLSTNIYSTVFGTGNANISDISPVAFLVDTCQNIYISGWGGNIYPSNPPPWIGSTTGMPITPGSAAQTTTDGNDFYFIVLEKNINSLLYGTFMGQAGGVGEHVDGGTSRFDKNGVVYQAICGGCGQSSAFPTTPGAWSNLNRSANCNLVALKIAFNLSAVDAAFTVQPDTNICVGETVTFINNSTNATNYTWNFGDGTGTSNLTSPTHTYNTGGTFIVTLVSGNPNACYESDTARLTMHVDTSFINADFNYQVTDSCDPFVISITNTSKISRPNPTFQWDFGDGTTFTGINPGLHNFPGTGTYTIRLMMIDPLACNSPDSATKTVTISNNFVKAEFETADVCENLPVVFTNKSSNGTAYLWNFGDGNTSTDQSPTHKYSGPGSYTVTLIVTNPKSCNKIDSFTVTVRSKKLPKADFLYEPLIPQTNVPTTFTNKSIDAASYNWAFGDGAGSTETNPSHFYKRSGSYTVCLLAKSVDGCFDSLCKSVSADVRPLVDVPTGFSPNGDGVNDVLYVRGAAIESIDFKIFNRWGELVFETNDISKGWDGSHKGKQQEMEVYAFTLFVTFIDETTTSKQGNITLLR